MILDVATVRAAYPALTDGHAYLDGAAGTQLPDPVIDAVAGAYRTWPASRDWPAPPARSANVDGVHATPHGPVDVRGLGADFYATSAYKWSGPLLGLRAAGGAVRAGLVHYNDRSDVDRLLQAVAELDG